MIVRVCVALLLVGCGSSSNSDMIFDQTYGSTCQAYREISRYAYDRHIRKSNFRYNDLLDEAADRYARNLSTELKLSADEGHCENLESLVEATSKPTVEVYSGALNNFMRLLDPHSRYVAESEVEASIRSEQSQAHGTGIQFQYTHAAVLTALPLKPLIVEFVYPGTPAFGRVEIGAAVEKIGEFSLEGSSIEDFYKSLDPSRSNVSYKFIDDPKIYSLEKIEFRKPAYYVKTFHNLDSRIAYMRIDGFTDGLTKETATALAQLEYETDGLILDLRGNPGGFMHEANRLLGQFISGPDELFYTRSDAFGTLLGFRDETYAIRERSIYSKPMVVLVDSDTASASEVVASVLQQRRRASIVGNRTFGKGSVQVITKVSPKNGLGGRLYFTIAVTYYPKGYSHQLRGVEPDFGFRDREFETASEILRERDPTYVLYESDIPSALQPNDGPVASPKTGSVEAIPEAYSFTLSDCAEDERYGECLIRNGESILLDHIRIGS